MGTYINKGNNASIYLLFRSLNRISDLWSKVLAFGKIKLNASFFLLFRSLNRIFVGGNNVLRIGNFKLRIEKVLFGFCCCGAFCSIFTSSTCWL